jgi:hypothetical protein
VSGIDLYSLILSAAIFGTIAAIAWLTDNNRGGPRHG